MNTFRNQPVCPRVTRIGFVVERSNTAVDRCRSKALFTNQCIGVLNFILLLMQDLCPNSQIELVGLSVGNFNHSIDRYEAAMSNGKIDVVGWMYTASPDRTKYCLLELFEYRTVMLMRKITLHARRFKSEIRKSILAAAAGLGLGIAAKLISRGKLSGLVSLTLLLGQALICKQASIALKQWIMTEVSTQLNIPYESMDELMLAVFDEKQTLLVSSKKSSIIHYLGQKWTEVGHEGKFELRIKIQRELKDRLKIIRESSAFVAAEKDFIVSAVLNRKSLDGIGRVVGSALRRMAVITSRELLAGVQGRFLAYQSSGLLQKLLTSEGLTKEQSIESTARKGIPLGAIFGDIQMDATFTVLPATIVFLELSIYRFHRYFSQERS